MKINNDLVVFDLETTDDEEHRIIEIGAVLLDRGLEPRDEMSFLVNPGVALSENLTALTGINEEMLAPRPAIAVALSFWKEWVRSRVGNLLRVRLCTWGNYFDVNVLRQEYSRIETNYPWSGTCFDVKTVAAVWCALSGRGTDKLGLKSVAGYMGVEPEGSWHRALPDAKVTAAVLKRAVADLAGGVWLPGIGGSHRRVEVKG